MKDKTKNIISIMIIILFIILMVVYAIRKQNKTISNESNEVNNIETIVEENKQNNEENSIIESSNEIIIEDTTNSETNNQGILSNSNDESTNKSEEINVTSTYDETAFSNGHLEHYPDYGSNYGNLIISKIGVNAPIIFGLTDDILLQGVAHDSGSYFPGENSSIIMCEHNYMNNFNKLGELTDGDIIEVKTSYGDFYYKVYDEQIVMDTEKSKLPIQTDKEILMLYTCYPMSNSNQTEYRYVIYAEKI